MRSTTRFTLVDLPGYGYARVSKARQAEWRPLIEGYLSSSRELRGVVQLLDARHDPTADDLAMLDFLADLGAPTIVAATKVDKLRASERANRLAALAAVTWNRRRPDHSLQLDERRRARRTRRGDPGFGLTAIVAPRMNQERRP